MKADIKFLHYSQDKVTTTSTQSLEHLIKLKIPPLLLTLLFAILMWGVSTIEGVALVEVDWLFSLSIFILGLGINISAIISFRAARTTMNPLKPKNASQLVKTGIYRYSRNPMYLGMLFLLISWALWLGTPFNLAVLILYVWYMTKFQIIHEEQALAALFPGEFESYKSRVRCWI